MSYALGLKAIRRLCEHQQTTDWFKAKLTAALFKPNNLPVFLWVDEHVKIHHALPLLETLTQQFPEVADIVAPEPPSYYVERLEKEYFYDRINFANVESSKILKADPNNWEPAAGVLRDALNRITLQRYRTKIMDFGAEAPLLVTREYHKVNDMGIVATFGWPYMDNMGGAAPGDVVSFIGRPQAGKSWLTLYTTLRNWKQGNLNTLFVSMEMGHLPIAQRTAAMIAGTNMTQLKQGQYATPTYDKFMASMHSIALADSVGGAKLYFVNGNLAADVEDIYQMADQLNCAVVVIDGAYLCRHKNSRLDRFTRAAENCESMKRYSEDLQIPTFSSWQFNRVASQKKAKGDSATLDDIGYSDAIGQISSIVLGLFQEDGVETMNKKKLRVLKGRGGEVGEFEINWNFEKMNFDQVSAAEAEEEPEQFADEYI